MATLRLCVKQLDHEELYSNMTQQEASDAIKDIPLGSQLELIKTNGDIIQVKLASHEVSGIEKKEYEGLTVPALPPAIVVLGGTRFGQFRIEIEEIVKIARISD